jgi:hypothetical protein
MYKTIGLDRVLEISSAAPGTGAVSLGGAVPGFRTFASVMAQYDTCAYFIEGIDGNGNLTGLWERGFGQITDVAKVTFARSLNIDSSSAGSLANFTSKVRIGSGPMSDTTLLYPTPGGRLSVSSTNPVADGESTTLYYLPYLHNKIPLFNGTGIQVVEFPATSLAIVATAGLGYDVFGYLLGSNLTLTTLAWTSATARATSLAYLNGFLCRSDDATRRYLGSFYGVVGNLVQDWNNYGGGANGNPGKRFLWNMYNRVRRDVWMNATINTWTYNATTWRVIQGLAPPQGCVEMFRGQDEDSVDIRGSLTASLTGAQDIAMTVGLDNTNTTPQGTRQMQNNLGVTGAPSYLHSMTGSWVGRPGLGYHNFQLVEYVGGAGGTGNVTFYGASNGTGLVGTLYS